MDPLTAGIMIVLGKYAMDKGVELTEKYGPTVAEKAKDLALTVLDKLRQSDDGAFIAGKFEDDPPTFEKPLEKELAKMINEDAAFADQLKRLFDDYKEAEKAAQPGGDSYNADVSGSSNVIVQGSDNVTAVGGSAAIGGDVGGDVNMGGKGKDE